jgi:hypothetical protein
MTKKLLELFSGTHSIGKVAKLRGYEVTSVDLELGGECPLGSGYKSDKHIKADIMTFDYKQFSPGEFDIITASPVCQWWSKGRYSWIGRKSKTINPCGGVVTRDDLDRDIMTYGVPMVDRIFEILDYLKPKYYWIENPKSGRMKEYINDLVPFHDVDYCKYCDWGYQKPTRFWSNIETFKPKICKKDCENIIEIKTQEGAVHAGTKMPIKSDTRKLHKVALSTDKFKGNHKDNKETVSKIHKINLCSSDIAIDENGKTIRINNSYLRKKYKEHKVKMSDVGGGTSKLERYRIPPKLIEELLDCCI